MEKIAFRFYLILILSATACKPFNADNKDRSIGESREVNNVQLLSFDGKTDVEDKAVSSLIKYLEVKDISLEDYYVTYIAYPIPSNKGNIDSFTLSINLIHQVSLDYNDSINELNEKYEELYKDQDTIPSIPPVTGSVSGKDKVIYYYLEKDSIVDVPVQ